MSYVYLFLAIFLEVTAAIATRFSEGFTRPSISAVVVVFAVASYVLFSLSLKHGMNIGIGYTIWSGVGVLTVALIGVVFLDDFLTIIQMGGIVLIMIGLGAVQLGGEKRYS
ncbi:SMR family transporter [Halalkalibacterium halodurans]|uniref:DMT family transporter n=1 Tax=Halalkalibacterium halodurans TaxID=86665 RepID=UPI002AA96C16|nr:SMR family transporter [Halalkalibacterium halodurans]MDY7221339.1 SMR family transporter [Halalkalibacterium halodurans]MDY7240578.1 SMR family transporter [Halalkalibacterium halodurans]MED4081388.1 SMR family transporter [Halalkalibacterium halodurans]MED4083330.1 SMR family transporter [Halalkalibacterium halodurans]MED4106479.1 SMR family transporter [Halalkalibacterium halodurans]